ncbi:MAG: hypothetical protein HIU89_00025 [Proteobacteria bacterium]|nr:hypothetical protein [Pseudomonadota bacterium]
MSGFFDINLKLPQSECQAGVIAIARLAGVRQDEFKDVGAGNHRTELAAQLVALTFHVSTKNRDLDVQDGESLNSQGVEHKPQFCRSC